MNLTLLCGFNLCYETHIKLEQVILWTVPEFIFILQNSFLSDLTFNKYKARQRLWLMKK